MNKFGQKIRDCGHPRISSARPGAAMMASIRNWAVPAVMAATLILSGCQTLNPDSAEGESNSLLKTLAVAFVGGAAIWGSTDSGSSDDRPLLSPRAEDPNGDMQPVVSLQLAGMTQGGRATVTIMSTKAQAGGLTVSVRVADEGFAIGGDPDTGQLAAIAAIVGSQANNHVSCEGSICTVTIREGETSATFTLIPVGEANDDPAVVNRWTVSLVPAGINDPFEIENGNRGAPPIEVANTPTGVRGGEFSTLNVIGTGDSRQFSTSTPELDRAAGPGGFNIDFTLPANLRPVQNQMVDVGGEMVPVTVTCQPIPTACTVTIPETQTRLVLMFEPIDPADTTEPVAIVVPPSDDYTILDPPTLPTPAFVVGFSTPQPTVDTDTGNVTFTFVSDTAAPVGGLTVSISIEGDAFTAMLPANCQGEVCTVVIPAGGDTATLILVPTGPSTTWRVAIVEDTNNNYGINDDSQATVPVTTTPFVVGFSTPLPTTDPDNGEVTFTVRSNVAAPAGGLTVSISIEGDAFTAMLPANCQGEVCTVVIPAGGDTATLILVPTGPSTTWRVAIVEDTNNNYGINDDSQATVPVTTTPFVVGFSTPLPTTDPDNGEVTFTVRSNVAAPAGGLTVSISIEGDAFTAMLPANCQGEVCTVVIPAGGDTATLILVPTGPSTTWRVAIVEDTNNNYGINDDSQATVPVTTTPFFVGFSTLQPTVEQNTGNVTFTVRSNVAAPAGGLTVSISIEGDAFTAMLSDGTAANCQGEVCTVVIPAGGDTATLILVPQGPDTTWEVAIVEDTNNNYRINVNSQAPVDVATTPFFVGFSTLQPTVEQNTGNVTFTVRSNVDAPAGGLTVSISIEGEGFTAMLLNENDGTRTPLDCPQNVCTVRIPVGTRTAAFILVPLGPAEGGSSDLDLTRWTVTIVDDPNNNYAIVDDSQAPVIVGEITLIAEGEADFTLDRNAPVRFGEVTALFRPQALPGDLDILEIPHAARITAESNADSFASGYGYFADDGGFLPFNTSIVDLGFSPSLIGHFRFEGSMFFNGQTTWRLRSISEAAPSGGHQIGIRVGGVADFTAMLMDGTPVDCPLNVCVVTIPEGHFTPPNLILTPAAAGFDPDNFDAVTAWDLEVAPIPRGNPLSPDPLSNNRANSDEAVFYARRGDKLVARFHTTGTFTDTANVALLTFDSFTGTDSLPPPFDREDFDPEPFNFLPGTDVNADCSNLASNTDPRRACNIELNAHEIRQTQLQNFYTSFGATYNSFAARVCADAGNPPMCRTSFSNANELNILVVDGFGGIGVPFRGDLALSEGEDVIINRPVAIALPITSTLVAAEDDVQELVYSYLVDADGDDAIDVDGNGFDVINTDTIGSALDFALYQSGEITNPLPPTDDFSISEIDPSRELLGRSNVRTFLYENEFSAIGAWLIPPTAEEVNADADAAYYAAAAHWFGFETPVDRIPTAGQAVYGGIATGDFRQVRFRFADTDNDPDTPLDETITNVESYYVHGNAQFDADFATSEMDGEFSLFAFNPEDVYGDPTLAFALPVDLLIVNWEGQILPDGRGFANDFARVLEPRVDAMGNIIYRRDPVTNLILTDPITGDQLPETREIIAPAGTLFQPLRVEESPADRMDPNSPAFGREPVFDNLVQIGVDNPNLGIRGVDPSLPAPIGSETLFSVFGKFFGPGNGAFPEEVAGELHIFNSRSFQLTPPMLDSSGDPVRNTGTSESVTSSLEVHFTADGAPVPDDRFEGQP